MDRLEADRASRADSTIAVSGLRNATDALRSASLRSLLTLLAVWNLFEFVAGNPLLGVNKPAFYVQMLASALLMVAIPFLLHREGHTKAACWTFLLSGSVVVAASQALAGGIRSPVSVLQLALAVTAILLLGKTGGVAVILLFLGLDAWLAWFQQLGRRLPEVFPMPPLAIWVLMFFAFTITMPPLWLAVQRLYDALVSAKLAEAQLRFDNAKLTEAQILTNSGNFLDDVTANSSMWSPGVFQILGIPAPNAEQACGLHPMPRSPLDFVPPEHKQAIQERIAWLRAGQPQELVRPVRRQDGKIRYLRVSMIPETDDAGKVTRISGIVRDETEQHAYETERQRMVDELRRLAAYREEAREAERKRIAREIHDELGQQLVGLKMRAAQAASLAGAGSPEAASEIAMIASHLETTIRSVRDIATRLRPEVLDRLGLVHALEWLAHEFTQSNKIPCGTSLEDGRAGDATATVIFRVAQEGLTNIAKHAQATQANLSLSMDSENIRLEVSDNGIGINAEDMYKTGSFGLAGMRERAATRVGTLTISRRESGGTVLRMVLPLGETDRRDQ